MVEDRTGLHLQVPAVCEDAPCAAGAGTHGGRAKPRGKWWVAALALGLLPICLAPGCRSAQGYRRQADRVAYEAIEQKQQEALGRTEPLSVDSAADSLRRRLLLDQDLPHSGSASLGIYDLPESEYWDKGKHLPEQGEAEVPWAGADPLRLGLLDALQVAARNSRDYQAAKEDVFRSALDLDLERNEFRSIFSTALSGLLSTNRSGTETVSGTVGSGEASVSRTLKSGAQLSGLIAVDLAKLLTQGENSSLGIFGDATISIPLLRGSGRRITEEPLTQAERDVVYSICEFERFKRTFAVRVAGAYLGVLRDLQQVTNAEENYKSLIASSRRARRLADAGKVPEFQFDQTVQDELRARDRWISARQSYASGLDAFKVLLSLPPDASVELDPGELSRLESSLDKLTSGAQVSDYSGEVPPADAPVVLEEPGLANAGPLEMDPEAAVTLALENRLDLRTARDRVEDAERKVYVAADALGAELTLLGSASAGGRRSVASATAANAHLEPDKGTYSALLTLDLPFERTAERNAYRVSIISLTQAVRDFQALEDQVKLNVLNELRSLLKARESLQIQVRARELAESRVKSTSLFLQAGRAEIRDLLDAQDALISAQNAVASAAVDYRIAELELQRDLGVLEVDKDGLWREYSPKGE